jgi:phosphohistidine phosphatase SixA
LVTTSLRCISFFALLFASPLWAADSALLEKLREGGYVLYVRHASTDFSQNDSRMTSYEDCAGQRNLTDKGRAEARMLGQQVRRLKIPVGRVLASPFCRTMETARLAFGRAEPMQEARGGPARPDDPARYAQLKQLMSQKVGTGKNQVIVSHGNPFYALAGPPYLAEGEIAVLDTSGSAFSIVGRVRIEDWRAFSASN